MNFNQSQLRIIYNKTEGYCVHCGKKLSFNNYGKYGHRMAWEIDHSKAKAKGGTNYFRIQFMKRLPRAYNTKTCQML